MDYIRLGSADLRSNIGNRVFLTFLTRDVSVRLQKDKVTKFVVFNMVDKDCVVEARLFGADDRVIELIQEGMVYDAAIDVKPYDKSPTGYSCIIYNIEASNVPPESFADWADGLPESKQIIENVLGRYIETYYGRITYHILVNNWGKFSKWSAASSMHHTQLGGLMTHTAEVAALCDLVSDYFNDKYGENFINKPLLLCAAVLHDIGKINELDVNTSSGKTEYSIHSSLATHIMDILSMVDLQANELNIGTKCYEDGTEKSPERLAEEREALELLRHCLAAHHGKLEYGSPITPSIPEAIILHIIDNLDADMYKCNKALKSIQVGEVSSIWTSGGYAKYYKDFTKIEDLEGDLNLDE